MMSREADYFERWHSAEQDLAWMKELQFATSWERMVLLACMLVYVDGYGATLPRPHKEHDLETLDAAITIALRYDGHNFPSTEAADAPTPGDSE